MALDVLRALEAAHAAGIIHCDVRPSNTVVGHDGKAVLIDWGLSRSAKSESGCCGVAAFAAEGVFLQGSYSARPAQDLGALLYTWLAVAHSASCDAPWLCKVGASDEEMFYARAHWLSSSAVVGADKVAELLMGGLRNNDSHSRVKALLEGIVAARPPAV